LKDFLEYCGQTNIYGSRDSIRKAFQLKQKDISVFFRGKVIGDFKTDLIVNEKVIVELKAVRAIAPAHEAQLMNYLKATNIEVGLLLNFGRKPEFKRFVYDNKRKIISDDQRRSVAE